VALVDVVADGLADEVAGNGVAGEAVFLQQRPLVVDVFLAGCGRVGICLLYTSDAADETRPV
jgi:hypothetical protein